MAVLYPELKLAYALRRHVSEAKISIDNILSY